MSYLTAMRLVYLTILLEYPKVATICECGALVYLKFLLAAVIASKATFSQHHIYIIQILCLLRHRDDCIYLCFMQI